MISLVVPYLEIDSEKKTLLNRFLDSVKGQYDELIIIDSKTDSYTKKVNDGLKQAKGSYLIIASDDIFLTRGSLRDLALNQHTVTFPYVNNEPKSFGVTFCLPRAVYEEIEGFDERYTIYCSDNDMLMTLKKHMIPYVPIESVNFAHPVGGRTVEKLEGINKTRKKDQQAYFEKWGEHPKDM